MASLDEYAFEDFQDFDETSSVNTDFGIDDRPPVERWGFDVRVFRAGSSVYSEKYSTRSVMDAIPFHGFLETVQFGSSIRESTFRNLVLMLNKTVTDTRFITLGKELLLTKGGGNLTEGIRACLVEILHGSIGELFQEYEQSDISEANEYSLCTSNFSVVYDQENSPAGGFISEVEFTENLEVEYPLSLLYGPLDCFFECISYSTKKKFDVDRARFLMKAEEGLIAIRHIKRFERMIRRQIVVYSDAVLNGCPVPIYKGTPDAENIDPIELVLFRKHYYLYKGIVQKTKQDSIAQAPNVPQTYIFYDFETYFCSRTYKAVPYAMSYHVASKDEPPRTGCIIKTTEEENIGLSVFEFFAQFREKHVQLIGFNNGAFDDYILFDILSSFGVSVSNTLIDRGSRILSFKSEGLISKDAYRFFISSLSSATQSFKCSVSKGVLDHELIQRELEAGRFTEWLKENKDRVVEYAVADVVSLAELYFKARKTFKEINENLNMDTSLTLSQMSMNAFRSSLPKGVRLPIVKDMETDSIIRKAMVGGRCQIFRACEEKEHEVQSIDVVSLYPYVMINREYPTISGRQKNFTEQINYFCEKLFGIYDVDILSQPKDAIVPSRNEDGTLDWDPPSRFRTWTDSVTLNCLRRHGGTFRVHSGIRFRTKKAFIFKEYLTPIMEKKEEQDYYKTLPKEHPDKGKYNPALRSCLKLLMNSLSGKMGQKPIEKERIICTSDPECDRAFEKFKGKFNVVHIRDKMWIVEGWYEQKDVSITSATILAILIYAYAREYMYDNFISKVEHKYGMDTDSLFLRSSEIRKIDPGFFGKKCGQMTIDLNSGSFGIYVAKKIYSNYRIIDGKEVIEKFKFKGIAKDDKLVPENKVQHILHLIRANQFTKLNKIWDDLPEALSLSTLRAILRNSKVHVLCSQIRRVFVNNKTQTSSLIIRKKFVLKEFPSQFTMPY